MMNDPTSAAYNVTASSFNTVLDDYEDYLDLTVDGK